MRRISLILAFAAVAAAGCSGGSRPPTSTGVAKGVTDSYFYVNVFTPPVGGTISSGESSPLIRECGVYPLLTGASSATTGVHGLGDPIGANVCGTSNQGTQTQYPWFSDVARTNLTSVTLTAAPAQGFAFVGWAGDCSGTGPCVLTAGADKTVVATFRQIEVNGINWVGHGSFTSPADHGPAYFAYASGQAGALQCKTCHGASWEGQGTAPGCGTCHAWPPHGFYLDKTYASGPAVTAECLKCHPRQADQVLASTHFTWLGNSVMVARNGVGKRNLINDFCVAVPSNEARCMQCHPSYSSPPSKDPATGAPAVNTGPMYLWSGNASVDRTKIDCLVCHADLKASRYAKAAAPFGAPSVASSGSCFPSCAANQICATTDATGAAWTDGKAYCRPPVTATEVLPALTAAATSVGAPRRNNCGFCHFNAGGGDNVKIGDLASSLSAPTFEMDVHMGSSDASAPTLCADCHRSANHAIEGAGLIVPVDDAGRLGCTDCHTGAHAPAHASSPTYTQHASFIACQTCHIPTFSRALFTKMDWDWRVAGDKQGCQGVSGCVPFGSVKYPDGSVVAGVGGEAPKAQLGSDPNAEQAYDWKKGVFVYRKNVVPVYRWVPPAGGQQGTHATVARDGMSGSGSAADPYVLDGPLAPPANPVVAGWKITPFKRMTGRTPAFADGSGMVVPHMFGPDSFWQTDLRGFPVVPNNLGSITNPWTEAAADAIWTGLLNYGAAVAGQLGTPVAKAAGGSMTRAVDTTTVTVTTLAALPATLPAQLYLVGAEAAFPSGVKTVTRVDDTHFTYQEGIPYTVNAGQPALPVLPATSTQFVAFYGVLPAWSWASTAMYINLNHEVAPKESALTCASCHPSFTGGATTSRMQELYTCADPAGCAY